MDLYAETGEDSLLEVVFKIYDRDGNGLISREEMKTTIKAIAGIEIEESIIDSTMEHADTDKDGTVDLEEFKALYKKVSTYFLRPFPSISRFLWISCFFNAIIHERKKFGSQGIHE